MKVTEQYRAKAAGRAETSANSRDFAVTDIRRQDHADGSIILENSLPLPSPLPDVMERLDHWGRQNPDAELISEPVGDKRRTVKYGDAVRLSFALADLLIERGLRQGDVVCVVAGAGCDHALIKLACLRAGQVHAPLSPSLADSATGRVKLSAMIQICKPSLILTEERILTQVRELHSQAATITLSRFVAEAGAVDGASGPMRERMAACGPDDTVAIYFTSGSTGDAKGVLITRRMISAVHGAITCHWPFLARHRPVMADWLPWHHVFGGLDNFFKMVWNGGTYHVRPAPTPETIEDAARFLARIRPTLYVDVPFGIKLLLNHLENDAEICAAFFSRLELIFFAGAGMDAETWSRLNRLVQRSAGLVRPSLRVASGYGSTEAASTICLAHEEPGSPGEIGVPLPGHTLRLVDVEGRTEIRVRGPNVSPSYIGASGSIPMPLDAEGFLRTGDVVAPVRPFHPELGLRFDGRVAEDFKLTNGTRVKVGALRQVLLAACAPYLGDVAIAGETHDYLCALLFPSHAAAGVEEKSLVRFFQKALVDHNMQWPNSSMAIRRAIIMPDPPDPDAGEVNDKGHLVQRRCLKNRQSDVERLYAKRPDPRVIAP